MSAQTTFSYPRSAWFDIESYLIDEREFASFDAAYTVLGYLIDTLDGLEPGDDPVVTIAFPEDEAAWVRRVAAELDPTPVEART